LWMVGEATVIGLAQPIRNCYIANRWMGGRAV
jgi:hypothetical protein